MEKMFALKAISELNQRKVKRQDGSEKVIYWYDVVLTNGIDTILAETSENLTGLISSTDSNVKLNLEIGACYMCRLAISVVLYEKDGKSSRFMKAVVHQIAAF